MVCLLARHRQDAAAALRTAVAVSAPPRDSSRAVVRWATAARGAPGSCCSRGAGFVDSRDRRAPPRARTGRLMSDPHDPPPFTPDRLLAEGRALRALARSLVGAEHGDDLVHDGYVAALR